MRIFSKFKDYYDSVRAWGVDPKLCYERIPNLFFTSDLKSKINIRRMRLRYLNYGFTTVKTGQGSIDFKLIFIGFCGKIYPCIKVVTNTIRDSSSHFFYNWEEFQNSEFFDLLHKWHKDDVKEILTQPLGENDPVFIEIGAPIFEIYYDSQRGECLQTNISLKDQNFFKVVDSFNTFQTISTYLGNVLVNREKPDKIPDRYKITQHGFDKYSFRHPTKFKE